MNRYWIIKPPNIYQVINRGMHDTKQTFFILSYFCNMRFTSFSSYSTTLSSLIDRAAACKERYNAKLFIVSFRLLMISNLNMFSSSLCYIESQHFPLLRKCIYGCMEENVANIPQESWTSFMTSYRLSQDTSWGIC